MAATVRNVDMSGVKEGGNFRPRRKQAGDYRAKIVKVDDHQPNDKTKPAGWVCTIQVDGDARSTYPYYLNPEEKQRWKIRAICIAAGIPIKLVKIRFDPNKLVGKAIGIELEDDEYNDRPKSSIADVFPVSEVGASADEDAPDDEDYDEPDEDVADEPEEEEEPPPAPKRRRRQPEPEPEPEDDEDEDEDPEDDEEEPPPPPRKRTARKTAPATKRVAKARTPEPEDDDDDLDLDELDED